MITPDQQCTLSGGLYNKHCLHCMTRKIKHARSTDHTTSRKIQLTLFAWMGQEMAQQVKDELTREKSRL